MALDAAAAGFLQQIEEAGGPALNELSPPEAREAGEAFVELGGPGHGRCTAATARHQQGPGNCAVASHGGPPGSGAPPGSSFSSKGATSPPRTQRWRSRPRSQSIRLSNASGLS